MKEMCGEAERYPCDVNHGSRLFGEVGGLDLPLSGGVAERLKAPVLKTGRGFALSRVRIPPPPFGEIVERGVACNGLCMS